MAISKVCLFCNSPIQGSIWNFNTETMFINIRGDVIVLKDIGMYPVCVNHMFALSLNPTEGKYITVPYGVPN